MIKWVQNASRTTIAITAIAMSIILFLCINLVSSLTIVGTRLDVTEEHIYTLTDETRQVISDVQEPITFRLYLSSSLVNADPAVRLLSEQVIELLKTYEIMSGGKIDFQQFDPVSLSVEEDDALGYGLASRAINVNDRAYFGLVATNTLDDISVIPYFESGATTRSRIPADAHRFALCPTTTIPSSALFPVSASIRTVAARTSSISACRKNSRSWTCRLTSTAFPMASTPLSSSIPICCSIRPATPSINM